MKQVLFSKYSNDRADRFAICTDIFMDENQKKHIRKRAVSVEAIRHIENIAAVSEPLTQQFMGVMKVAKCNLMESAVEFEFVEGVSLESVIEGFLNEGDKNSAAAIMRDFCNKIYNLPESEMFTKNKQFEDAFGEISFEEKQKTLKITDLDLLFDNIIVTKDAWTIIDYEWSFSFPIPVKFVVYRTLFYWYARSENRDFFQLKELMELAGITPQEEKIFEQMEQSFQGYIVGNNIPVRCMQEELGNSVVPFEECIRNNQIQVFFDKGDGFSEENSIFLQVDNNHRDIKKNKFWVPDQVMKIRIDPMENSGLVYIKQIVDSKGRRIDDYIHNGKQISKDILLFVTRDPQIVFDIDEDIDNIVLEIEIIEELGHIVAEMDSELDSWRVREQQLEMGIQEMEQQVLFLNTQLNDILNSSSWKITAPFRNIKRRFQGDK